MELSEGKVALEMKEGLERGLFRYSIRTIAMRKYYVYNFIDNLRGHKAYISCPD